ncbi:hypothetical protein OTU49_002939, partial [Cherax quadricarinatus]
DSLVRPKEVYKQRWSTENGKPPETSSKYRKEKEETLEHRQFLYMKQKHIGEYHMSEDCLTLNVYTPILEGAGNGGDGDRSRDANDTMPVLFYVHGGSFFSNGGRLYPGEKLASEGIVV